MAFHVEKWRVYSYIRRNTRYVFLKVRYFELIDLIDAMQCIIFISTFYFIWCYSTSTKHQWNIPTYHIALLLHPQQLYKIHQDLCTHTRLPVHHTASDQETYEHETTSNSITQRVTFQVSNFFQKQTNICSQIRLNNGIHIHNNA